MSQGGGSPCDIIDSIWTCPCLVNDLTRWSHPLKTSLTKYEHVNESVVVRRPAGAFSLTTNKDCRQKHTKKVHVHAFLMRLH